MRRASSLVELLVALALATGPLLTVIGLAQSQAREVHAMEESERMSALLHDAMDLLSTETPQRLDELAEPARRAELQSLVDGLLATAAGNERGWKVYCSLSPAPENVTGLAMVRLAAQRHTGARMEIKRLLHRRARPAP